jgi:hypothetical protein
MLTNPFGEKLLCRDVFGLHPLALGSHRHAHHPRGMEKDLRRHLVAATTVRATARGYLYELLNLHCR